jgi:DnaK suppressor protein
MSQKKARSAKDLHSDLKTRLKEQRDEIMCLFRQDLGVGQGSSSSHEGEDDVDRANFDFSREMALSMSTGEREVLRLIAEALDRLSVGVYGTCSNCSRSITEARLVALPWARHCVDCQELDEKGLLGA